MEEHEALTRAAESGPGALMARAQSFPSSAPVPPPGLTCRFCSPSSVGNPSGSASFSPAPLATRSRRRGNRHCDPALVELRATRTERVHGDEAVSPQCRALATGRPALRRPRRMPAQDDRSEKTKRADSIGHDVARYHEDGGGLGRVHDGDRGGAAHVQAALQSRSRTSARVAWSPWIISAASVSSGNRGPTEDVN